MRRARHEVLFACLCLCGLAAAGGCERVASWVAEPRAEVEAPQRFERDAISFAYPGNWSVREETSRDSGVELRTITVESAGHALVMIQSFVPALDIDVAEHLEATLDAMQAELGKEVGGLAESSRGPVSGFEREFLGARRSGQRAAITVTSPGETVPSSLALIGAELEGRTVLLFMSSPDEDRASVEAGFEQVIATLRVDG